jgi:mannose-6-phosphate isomerase-like protein (cupin superfamily)
MTMAEPSVSHPTWIDLLECCHAATHSGPQWGHECEDLDLTLLSWNQGVRIEAHVNAEVDGVLIGVEGSGIVTVDGQRYELRPGVALVIPKGCKRAIQSTAGRLSYLSVHRRRRGLMPAIGGRPVA